MQKWMGYGVRQEKSKMERIKNEHIKEIMGVRGKPDIVDIIGKKRLQWYGLVKKDVREENTKIHYGMGTRGETKKGDVLEKHGWTEYKQP
jgi:hypothetical protein